MTICDICREYLMQCKRVAVRAYKDKITAWNNYVSNVDKRHLGYHYEMKAADFEDAVCCLVYAYKIIRRRHGGRIAQS